MYKDLNEEDRNEKIKREMKIEKRKKDYNDIDNMLKTVSKKFLSEPLNLEKLNKQYNEFKEKRVAKDELPSKKKNFGDKAIFYDIFIKPKEEKINEIREKRQMEKKALEDFKKKALNINDPNYLNHFKKTKVTSLFTSKIKGFMSKLKKGKNLVDSNFEEIFEFNSVAKKKLDPEILYNFLIKKFAPQMEVSNKGNFFNQLIQIKPPEGINAVVASPLLECKLLFLYY